MAAAVFFAYLVVWSCKFLLLQRYSVDLQRKVASKMVAIKQ